ncbi:MAG: DUF4386 domain-containing protein [Daejeonella sp.]|uniref:DUF4386 domain-containing protein n=1 Tax=Daejeonella sp. TaxID=2805397 RepID=UPI00273528E3|nr:DUF4386 domain-containing protein [Daejeonella sp.]MDP3467777.1 DUF4386 domain-containing protein [Daejeonella sp.]
MERSITSQKDAITTGAFFITATVAAIIGISLYDPILNDSNTLSAASANSNQIELGALFELILAFANIGTGIMLFPFLRRYSESWGLAYACFRLLEVVFILIGIISLLSIVKLSQEYSGTELAALQSAAKTLKTIHSWSFILGPHFMLGINTFIYSYIFYQSGLVPRRLSILGLFAAVLILIAAVQEILGFMPHFSAQIIPYAFPIAIYEMILAVWLIRKGFNLEMIRPVQYLSETY